MVRRLVLYAPIVAGLGEQQVAEPFHTNTWIHAAEDFQTAPDGGIDFRIVERPVADTFLSNAWRNDKTSSPIIVGSKDPYVSPALCEEAYKTLPDRNSRLEIIEGGGHAMLMERPYYRKFRAKVRAFLSRGAR